MKKTILTFISLGLLASCTENMEHEIPEMSDKTISINTNIISSRAPILDENGSGNFTDGDKIYLTAEGNTSGKWFSREFAVGVDKLSWDDIQMDDDTEAVFSAFYPVPENANQGKFDFNASTSEFSDILMAKQIEANVDEKTTLNLSFVHVMHKLEIKYVSKNGDYSEENLNNITTSCTALTTCEVDMKKSTVNTSQSSSGTYNTKAGKTVDFIIVPQNTDEVSLTINLGNGKTVNKQLNEICQNSQTLESGKKLTITFDISINGVEIIASQINGWDSQGTFEDEIIV